jgi:type IV secretion system protein TrbF
MFNRPSIRYARTPLPDTPYQRASQVWDERIGAARIQARSWRYACFAALGLSATLTGGIIWQNARGTIVPWVVEVDKLGEARVVAPADAGFSPSDPQIAFHLAHFIEHVRAIPDDPIVVRRNWLRAYDFASDRGALALNDHARANDPFARVGREQVSVDVTSVIRASPRSFRVAWIERRYRDGALADTTRWTAILGITLQPPNNPDALTRNPLGIFVTSINWSKELG